MPILKRDKTSIKHLQKQSFWTIAFVVLVGYGANVQVGTSEYFDFSLQTFFLIICFYFMNREARFIAVILYFLAGGFGLPVFAGGSSGWAYFVGPSLGFFIAFLLSASAKPWGSRYTDYFAYGALLHLLILSIGLMSLLFYGWTLAKIGEQGLELLPGAVVKSLAAAAVILILQKLGLNRSDSR